MQYKQEATSGKSSLFSNKWRYVKFVSFTVSFVYRNCQISSNREVYCLNLYIMSFNQIIKKIIKWPVKEIPAAFKIRKKMEKLNCVM